MSAVYNSLDFTLSLEVLREMLSDNHNAQRKDLAQGLGRWPLVNRQDEYFDPVGVRLNINSQPVSYVIQIYIVSKALCLKCYFGK